MRRRRLPLLLLPASCLLPPTSSAPVQWRIASHLARVDSFLCNPLGIRQLTCFLIARQILGGSGTGLPAPEDADANRVPPRPQSLVPSLPFRPQPILHSQWVSAYKLLPRRAIAVSFGEQCKNQSWTRSDDDQLHSDHTTPSASSLWPPRSCRPPKPTSITGKFPCNIIGLVSEMPLRSIGTGDRDRAASKCTARSPCLST